MDTERAIKELEYLESIVYKRSTLMDKILLAAMLALVFATATVTMVPREAQASPICDKDRRDAGQCQAPCGFMRKCNPRTPTK